MSSFNVGAETVGSKTWEELYRENLAKNGIPYEKAPIRNGVIQVKDVGVLDHLAAATKAFIMAPVKVGEKVYDSATDALDASVSTVKAIPLILIVLAVGVTGYLIFAGKKGTDLTKFIPIPRK